MTGLLGCGKALSFQEASGSGKGSTPQMGITSFCE